MRFVVGSILAISGSLRGRSINTAILRAAGALAPAGVEIGVFGGLGQLPHFNPDLDGEAPPPAVAAFREAARAAGAVLISSPEYARGVPGSLKNALDWLVGYPPFAGKPVGLINARPGSVRAFESLQETLATMSARLVPDAIATLPLRTNALDVADLLAMPEAAEPLRAAVGALAAAARSGEARG